MKKLLLSLILVQVLVAQGQFRELKRQPFDNIEAACLDSTYSTLYTVTASIDTTRIYTFDTAAKVWNPLTLISVGANPKNMNLSCQVDYRNALYVSGLIDSNGFSVRSFYQGSWRLLGRLVHSQFNTKGNFYMNLYKFKNEVYLVHNADTVLGQAYSTVYKLTPTSLIPLGGKILSREYHMDIWKDTLLLSAGNVIHGYSNSNWFLYNSSIGYASQPITGLAVNNNRICFSQGTFIKRINGNFFDSIYTDIQVTDLCSIDTYLYVLPKTQSDRYVISAGGTTSYIKAAFALANPDSMAVRLIQNRPSGFYLYYANHNPIRFGKYNYGPIAQVYTANFKYPSKDSADILPYIDHNHNKVFDAGDSIMTLKVTELNGFRTFNISGKMTSVGIYDNESFCVKGPDRVYLDSCYEADYDAYICSETYLSPKRSDTLFLPYICKSKEGMSNVTIKMEASGPLRLDIPRDLKITLTREDCNTGLSAGKLYVYIADSASVISSTPNYTAKIGNRLEYSFSLAAQSNTVINIRMLYPSGNFQYGTKQVVRGTIINTINEMTNDNEDSVEHRLMYSFDPNAKYSFPEGRIKYGVNSVRFHIDFQNMGNDKAHRVTVVDTLSFNIPVYEFKMIGASHNYKIGYQGTIVSWTFDDINLLPRSVSESLSKGYVEFEAKVRSELRVGDSIINNALIYFDNNEPIYTNASKLSRVTSMKSLWLQEHLEVYPNPASGYFNVVNNSEETLVMDVYDATGRLIGTHTIIGRESYRLDCGDWSTGVYICQVRGYGGYTIIKE